MLTHRHNYNAAKIMELTMGHFTVSTICIALFFVENEI